MPPAQGSHSGMDLDGGALLVDLEFRLKWFWELLILLERSDAAGQSIACKKFKKESWLL